MHLKLFEIEIVAWNTTNAFNRMLYCFILIYYVILHFTLYYISKSHAISLCIILYVNVTLTCFILLLYLFDLYYISILKQTNTSFYYLIMSHISQTFVLTVVLIGGVNTTITSSVILSPEVLVLYIFYLFIFYFTFCTYFLYLFLSSCCCNNFPSWWSIKFYLKIVSNILK